MTPTKERAISVELNHDNSDARNEVCLSEVVANE